MMEGKGLTPKTVLGLFFFFKTPPALFPILQLEVPGYSPTELDLLKVREEAKRAQGRESRPGLHPPKQPLPATAEPAASSQAEPG